jgi:hypothetical protein
MGGRILLFLKKKKQKDFYLFVGFLRGLRGCVAGWRPPYVANVVVWNTTFQTPPAS